jgi:hypothetical protein
MAYSFDAASHLTGLTYKNAVTLLGDLTYSYDQSGRVTQVGGSFARTGLPGALASATYDAANRLSTWGSTSYT